LENGLENDLQISQHAHDNNECCASDGDKQWDPTYRLIRGNFFRFSGLYAHGRILTEFGSVREVEQKVPLVNLFESVIAWDSLRMTSFSRP
jgi:hypothetical protein